MCRLEEKKPLLEAEKKEEKESKTEEEEDGEEEETWRSWLVVAAAFLCISVLDGAMYSSGMLAPSLAKELRVAPAVVAAASSLQVAASAMVAPLAAFTTSRLGPRLTSLLGSLAAALGLLLASLAPSLPLLVVGHSLLAGLGFGLMYLPGVVAVAGAFTRRRSLAIGLTVAGSGAGQVLLGPLVGQLVQVLGWRWCLRVLALVCLLCALASLLLPPPGAKEVGRWAVRVLGRGVAGQRQVPVYLLYLAGDGLAVMALYIPYSVLPALSPDSSLLVASLGLGSVVGRLAAGALCDHPHISPLALTATATALAAPLPLLLTLLPASSLPLLAATCALLGLLTGAWIASTSPLLVSLLGLPHLGTAFGRLTAVRGAAALLSPPLAALLAQRLGLRLLPLHLSSGLLAGAAATFALAALVAGRRRPKPGYSPL